jgi:hypothetical protein
MCHLKRAGGQAKPGNRKTRLLHLDPEFFKNWDSFVENHPSGSIYHLSGWKKVLEDSFNHIRGEIIAICDEGTKEILGGLPVYHVGSIITGKRWVAAPFTNFCEPLTNDPGDARHLLDYLVGRYDQEKPAYIEVRARPGNHLDCGADFGTAANYVHHFLKLDHPAAVLLGKFHKKAVRVPILKAVRNNFLLRSADSEKDILEFYRIYHTARRRIGLPSIPYAFFKNLWDVFHPSGRMQVIMGVLDHQVAGASILLKFKEWVHIEYGHDRLEFRKMGVNHFLDWEAIRTAVQEKFKFVSFGRTSIHNSGLTVYKSHWGTTAERLLTHYYPKAGREAGKQKEASWQYRLTRQVCARAPRSVYDLISAFVYRHLG